MQQPKYLCHHVSRVVACVCPETLCGHIERIGFEGKFVMYADEREARPHSDEASSEVDFAVVVAPTQTKFCVMFLAATAEAEGLVCCVGGTLKDSVTEDLAVAVGKAHALYMFVAQRGRIGSMELNDTVYSQLDDMFGHDLHVSKTPPAEAAEQPAPAADPGPQRAGYFMVDGPDTKQ